MKKLATTLFKLTLGILLTASFSLTYAQGTGKLTGKITDAKSGEVLIGASVLVQGLSKGAATNVNGEYNITALPAGTYEVLVRYVGYQNKLISDVQVKGDAATSLNITLTEANTQQLQAVTVRATFRQESASSLYAQQKNNSRITDGISAEAIRRSPDRNTADVLKRVSGVTVADGRYVVVRGLSDRYNNAQLDGANLPSTEPNKKAFSFDIVPSNLVDNIVISKTATPDLPGDFTGGNVQITTKDIPDKNFITFGIGAGYNTATTFKDFKSGTRNATDYLGFDNGKKQLPSNFPSSTRISEGFTAEQNIIAANRLPKNFNIYNNSALPNQNYQFTIGRVKDFEKSNNRLGAIVSLTYRNTQNYYKDLTRDYFDFNYNDQVYRFATNIGGLANFAYTFGKNKITLKNTYNRLYEDQFLQRTGTNAGPGNEQSFFAFDLLQKSLFKSTLEGTHSVGTNSAKFTWLLSYSNVFNDQPDQRKVNYARNIGSNDPFQANVTTLGKENSRLFSDLNENGYTGSLNYTSPVKMFSNTATFKAGLNSYYRKRDFNVRYIGLVLINNPNFDDYTQIRARSLNSLFGSDLINTNRYKLDELPGAAISESYSANSLTNAGYLMLDNKIGKNLRVVWGARVEQFNLDLTSTDRSTIVDQNYVDVLPSVNLTYSLTPKANLRFSYARTLARPEFRELSNFGYFDYEQIATLQGNPDLKKTQVDNVDLRYEFYPSAGQIISVSAFYKRFKNAIETYNFDLGSNRLIIYQNSPKANIFGAEFEFRKTLDFISTGNLFKNTTAYTNVTLIKSKATNPTDLGFNLNYTDRPLVGQAPYVINAGLTRTFMDNKYTFNALYNVVGRRLNVVGGTGFPAIWEAPRNVIDLQFGVRVLKGRGELKLNAADVLNQRALMYFDVNENKKYDAGEQDQTLSRYRAGSTYSFVFTYNL
ncbi:TonB-dependent receptor domain-containing protein [Mucilaginibacter terrae]|uniref:TonB-dependent receptor n=1 Tax=Mucilaginibacter terrae TaxID=1955052 RepID=UPI003625528E